MTEQIILIVEDEPTIADNIRFALETEGFKTCWHALGMDVLPLLASQPSDLAGGTQECARTLSRDGRPLAA